MGNEVLVTLDEAILAKAILDSWEKSKDWIWMNGLIDQLLKKKILKGRRKTLYFKARRFLSKLGSKVPQYVVTKKEKGGKRKPSFFQPTPDGVISLNKELEDFLSRIGQNIT